jgi:hypothetical protein
MNGLDGDKRLYLSHTQGRKDPLSYDQKLNYAQKAFGKIVKKSDCRTIMQVMQELQTDGYTDVVLITGSDRTAEFEYKLRKYNGVEYKFNSVNVVSAGDRDPDSDEVAGMSASKLRSLAVAGDQDQFVAGVADMTYVDKIQLYNDVRSGLKK